jgi:hypothetical protein
MKWRSVSLVITAMLAFNEHSVAQTWYKTKDSLRLPASLGNIYTASGDLIKYDTVPVTYALTGSKELRKGFKMVHISKGYYVDDSSTVRVFFDDRLHKINDVERFYFR